MIVVDADKPYGALEYIERLVQKFADDDHVSLALAPHAPYTVSRRKLEEVRDIARKHNLLIHIHAAEFAEEHLRIEDNHQRLTTISYLENIGFLGDNTLLAHCIHLNDRDFEKVADCKASIAHNPLANAKGATGVADLQKMFKQCILVGLGTDGPMGSNKVDLFRAMCYASTCQRLKHDDETIMTPPQIVRMATLGGAEALGISDKTGSLEAGKLADIVVVETRSTNMNPNFDPYATLVFQANSQNVSTTIVQGNTIVENRELMTFDLLESKSKILDWQRKIAPLGKRLARKSMTLSK